MSPFRPRPSWGRCNSCDTRNRPQAAVPDRLPRPRAGALRRPPRRRRDRARDGRASASAAPPPTAASPPASSAACWSASRCCAASRACCAPRAPACATPASACRSPSSRRARSEHWLRCASVAPRARRGAAAPSASSPSASCASPSGSRQARSPRAKLGELPTGRPRLHRPDLAVLGEAGPIAVEVELTPKAPRRLEAIIRAWRRASWVAEVRYLCAPGATRRALERGNRADARRGARRVFEAVSR